MKKRMLALLLACGMAWSLLTGCGSPAPETVEEHAPESEVSAEADQVADPSEMVTPEEVVEEGMVPILGDAVKDGTYPVTVDSSSSMFNITKAELTVTEGRMTAVMTMGGTGYLYVFPGSAEEAAAAEESTYIPYEETAEGVHTFTIPVEALDLGIPCAAYSKRKELWYDRTLLFRADSLPADAFAEGLVTTLEELGLADGVYTVEVTLEGGSGRASVESPARLTVEDGSATAELVWSSSHYDYMKVDGVQYDPVNTQGNSVFVIPVAGFDYKMPVLADTTAMSTPYEIEYTLTFDAATIQAAP